MFPTLFATARSTRPFFTSPLPDLEKSWCGTAPVTERAGSEGTRKGDTWHVGSLLGREWWKVAGRVVENVSAVKRKFSLCSKSKRAKWSGERGHDRVGKRLGRASKRLVSRGEKRKKKWCGKENFSTPEKTEARIIRIELGVSIRHDDGITFRVEGIVRRGRMRWIFGRKTVGKKRVSREFYLLDRERNERRGDNVRFFWKEISNGNDEWKIRKKTHVQWNIIFDQNDRIIYRSKRKQLLLFRRISSRKMRR